jgi:hypothetical protein
MEALWRLPVQIFLPHGAPNSRHSAGTPPLAVVCQTHGLPRTRTSLPLPSPRAARPDRRPPSGHCGRPPTAATHLLLRVPRGTRWHTQRNMARLGLQTLRSSTDDNVYQLNAMQTWCVHPPPLADEYYACLAGGAGRRHPLRLTASCRSSPPCAVDCEPLGWCVADACMHACTLQGSDVLTGERSHRGAVARGDVPDGPLRHRRGSAAA